MGLEALDFRESFFTLHTVRARLAAEGLALQCGTSNSIEEPASETSPGVRKRMLICHSRVLSSSTLTVDMFRIQGLSFRVPGSVGS